MCNLCVIYIIYPDTCKTLLQYTSATGKSGKFIKTSFLIHCRVAGFVLSTTAEKLSSFTRISYRPFSNNAATISTITGLSFMVIIKSLWEYFSFSFSNKCTRRNSRGSNFNTSLSSMKMTIDIFLVSDTCTCFICHLTLFERTDGDSRKTCNMTEIRIRATVCLYLTLWACA